jgi:hypothetical protein
LLARVLRRFWFRAALPLILFACVLIVGSASATRIEYDIVSSQDPGTAPFSGLFADPSGDDDDDDRSKHGLRILSDDQSSSSTTRSSGSTPSP